MTVSEAGLCFPTMTWLDLLLYLLIAAIAGGIGRAIAGGTRGGCIVSIVLGFIGSMLGSWLARELKLPEVFVIRLANPAAHRLFRCA